MHTDPLALPTLFCLHHLGGSAREWPAVAQRLERVVRCVAIDLAGFGDAAEQPGYTVAEMAEAVAAVIRAEAAPSWMIAGHSMGAKVAAVIARRAEDGEPGLSGLAGFVAVAGSPASPEPMDAAQRQRMLGWFQGDAAQSRAEAQSFVDENVGQPLDPAVNAMAVADVLRCNPAAWRSWLTGGSTEDWSGPVAVLNTPALIIAGGADGALGPDAQHGPVARHFAVARVVVLQGAGHLLPLERPDDVARLIAEHVRPAAPVLPEGYRQLIEGDRVSARTRAALLERAQPDDPAYRPQALSPAQFAVLRAVTARTLPQPAPGTIDLAARIDALLHAGAGDGWRFALLPPDGAAYRAALDTLDAAAGGFAANSPAGQDAWLQRAAEGVLAGQLDGRQMQLWFEDVRAEATRAYVAHPATMARIGYGGIGYGGDGPRKPGFVRLGVGECEAWEPVADQPA